MTDHPGAERSAALWLVPREQLVAVADGATAAGARLAGAWAWDALRVAAWRPRLAREVDDRTLPHELDWLRTAVHLSKGCYRGQESVARVFNLGKPRAGCWRCTWTAPITRSRSWASPCWRAVVRSVG